jgi:hypothetical protein
VFENRAMRKIFGPKRDEVTGEWRKLITRRMRCARHVARRGEKRNPYRLLVGKPEGKRQLGRPRRRWVHNVRMDLGMG